MSTTQDRRFGRTRWTVLSVLVVIGVLAVGVVVALPWWHDRTAAIAGQLLDDFPDVDVAALDSNRSRIVTVLRTEYAHPGDGPTYAEGVDEPWCADFVSWTMRQAGQPLSNPNSGSWRIPGVATLQEYFEANGRFSAVGSGYSPRPGDVVIYAPGSPFGQHTNIVLAAGEHSLTTIGGNERGSVRIHRYDPAGIAGIVGFGHM
ncbi:CHAP domain-containing protein [Nocardia sp. BSTN01]|uniref:CHAP domain-containing protein n=1 Tax=Nocardia sp. BSTN01 TaxID=2783665 RepID=UPI00188E18D9|nr:CHAP domain-containing protein [Nocardia sp. BSTN01]MBF5001209.1 CHAP domain-containing protein [Nocardia sp. BSTN01]